ncbi:MAG TPA: hypothetical protein VN823_15895 [Stellaceae bacterium]|nr:hypothetical protein [Stellaceae bacterium]
MSQRIIVHSLADARAALAAASALGLPVTLASAPGAGTYAGPHWFLALVAEAAREHPGVAVDAVIDCADEAGTALAALRAGCKRVHFTGRADTREKLGEIAAALGAEIEGGDRDALDLLDQRDPEAACRAYLGHKRER